MESLVPGTSLGHYRLVAKLGQGGQATVFKAEDLRLGRFVVVKVLRPELALTEAARKRFEREACLCSALEHPNISALYDIGEAEGVHYLVMQYVEGQTLERFMAGGPLGTQSALSLAVQIADALAIAHAHGIVHRDIKPSNVIVTAEGQAKVLDFGLAKMIGGEEIPGVPAGAPPSDTQVGVPYGTLGYGSPEQASGSPVDHRTDIFSLGVVMYEMFTGQRPFRGKHAIDLLHAVIHVTPRPAAEVMRKKPVAVNAVDDQEVVATKIAKYNLLAVPVLETDGSVVGFVTVDDVVDVLVEEGTEDILRLAAVEPGAMDEPYVATPFWTLIRKRAGWLLILFLSEMLTATAMGRFEEEIARAVVLALFVPLIISSGGNSGSQAASLIIRALAVGELAIRDWWRVMRREVFAGLVLGATLGIVGFMRITVWSLVSPTTYGPHWPLVAVTVWLSLIGVVLWRTFAGSMLPIALKRVGMDPAVSSAPFVATLVDVTGIVIYFEVAAQVLRGTLL